MKKIKAIEIIEKRDNISKQISRLWEIINTENIVPNGFTRNYDLKQCLKNIELLANKRKKYKLYAQCINMNIKSIKELSEYSIYPIIFELSEKSEMFKRLGDILRDVEAYSNNSGKRKTYKNVELSKTYIKDLRDKLTIEINSLKKQLEDFNNAEDTEIEIDENDD